MKKTIKYVGMDVHKDSITIAIADDGRDGEVRFYGKIAHNLNQIDKVMRKLISQNSELRCVYEAGPCGYPLHRHLSNKGIDCAVVAPALIPKKSGDRVKNDRRDAVKLAILHRAGELTAVYVPDQEDEAIRDLVRTRADIQKAVRKLKQQINAFLLGMASVIRAKANGARCIATGLRPLRCRIQPSRSPSPNIWTLWQTWKPASSASTRRSYHFARPGDFVRRSTPYNP